MKTSGTKIFQELLDYSLLKNFQINALAIRVFIQYIKLEKTSITLLGLVSTMNLLKLTGASMYVLFKKDLSQQWLLYSACHHSIRSVV